MSELNQLLITISALVGDAGGYRFIRLQLIKLPEAMPGLLSFQCGPVLLPLDHGSLLLLVSSSAVRISRLMARCVTEDLNDGI